MPPFRPLPPPDPNGLERLPLHVLVRDWPELLAVLRRAGVDLQRYGALSSGDCPAFPGRGPLLASTAWRGGGGGG